jgi:hypothetical protein
MTEPLATDEVGFPLFNKSVILNVPDFFVLPSKKVNKFKLVRGLTPSGKNFTTRAGHKSIQIKKSDTGELYLEAPRFDNPRIEYGMFSKRDQNILKEYFKDVRPPSMTEVSFPSANSVASYLSNATPKYHYEYVDGKRRRILNQPLQSDIMFEAENARKRRRATSNAKKQREKQPPQFKPQQK